MLKFSILLTTALVILTSCSVQTIDQPFEGHSVDLASLPITYEKYLFGRTTSYVFKSLAVSKNMVDDPADAQFLVTLPASYETTPEKRYPVVYGLHGYGDSTMQFTNTVSTPIDADSSTPEAIIVSINGTNILSGSFYASNDVIGDWISMVADEVRTIVDSKFRTIKSSKARMIAGFSMGGFGAWNIGLKRPDIFGHIWALAPGVFEPGAIVNGIRSWEIFSSFLPAYAAAFAPDRNAGKSFYRPITIADLGKAEFADYLKELETGFGDVEKKLATYNSLGRKLQDVQIVVGTQDGFSWIKYGSVYLSQKMKDNGMDVSLKQVDGMVHEFNSQVVSDLLIPYMKKAFETK